MTILPEGMSQEVYEQYIKYRANRNSYWAAIAKVARECQSGNSYSIGAIDILGPYLETTYGIRMKLDAGQMITSEYTVVDEAKYTLFLLKFM